MAYFHSELFSSQLNIFGVGDLLEVYIHSDPPTPTPPPAEKKLVEDKGLTHELGM